MKSVKIGTDSNYNSIYQPEDMNESFNRHCLYTGITGSGKTYGMKSYMYRSVKAGVSVIAIDFAGAFSIEKMEHEFIEKSDCKIDRKNVREEGIGINLFKGHLINSNSGGEREEPSETADRIVDVLDKIYKFGCKQKAKLYQCIVKGLGDNVEKLNTTNEYYSLLDLHNEQPLMDFRLLQYLLKERDDQTANEILDRMESFIDKHIFRGKELQWHEILYGEPSITIIDLSGFSNEIQKLIVEFLLWDLWYFTVSFGDEHKPFVMVLDECQNLNHKHNSPTAKILTEGRKFGWSCQLGTQFLQGQFKVDEIRRIQQAALQFYFKPSLSDINYISKSIGNDASQNKAILENLSKGMCLLHGTVETDTGRIIQNATIKLYIR